MIKRCRILVGGVWCGGWSGGDLAERGREGGREKEVGELRRVALEVGEKESILLFFLMFQRQGEWKARCVASYL